jgi:hypothetical protein
MPGFVLRMPMSDPEKPTLRIVKPIPHIISKPRKLPVALKRAASEAAELVVPNKTLPTPKKNYVVNRVTEYGALFNRLNEERIAKRKPPLKTAMEILIEAMQSKEIDLKDKAKIAEKLATFESSRAPIISIEHVNNITRDEEVNADDAMEDFMVSLQKVR